MARAVRRHGTARRVAGQAPTSSWSPPRTAPAPSATSRSRPWWSTATRRTAGCRSMSRKERCVGVLLVRLGGHAAGVFSGSELMSSKVGSRLVHGRSAAGGQSQQRFARRREGQVRVALQDAVAVAIRILLPAAADLDAVVLGGDRTAVEHGDVRRPAGPAATAGRAAAARRARPPAAGAQGHATPVPRGPHQGGRPRRSTRQGTMETTVTLTDHLPAQPDPDALFDAFAGVDAGAGADALPGAGGGADRGRLRRATSSSARRPARGRAWSPPARTSPRWPQGRRTFYTAPIKALVSEKFFALCATFGADKVGMMTGDASVNADAPIICCTAEILANLALREGAARRRRPGRDGRVPLLRRPRPRLGLAGAAARAAAGAVPADVGDARRRHAASRTT